MWLQSRCHPGMYFQEWLHRGWRIHFQGGLLKALAMWTLPIGLLSVLMTRQLVFPEQEISKSNVSYDLIWKITLSQFHNILLVTQVRSVKCGRGLHKGVSTRKQDRGEPSYRLATTLSNIHFLFSKINLFIYFWLRWVFVAVRGLSLVAVSGGYSSLRCTGFSLRRLLLLWSTGCRHEGSVVVAHGLSCSAACGIFPDHGSNPYPLHWQADS